MSDTGNLIEVKRALAAKYERLARKTSSQPKKRQFAYRAVKYRRQLAQLQQVADS